MGREFEIGVAITSHCVQRIEHGRLEVGKGTQPPIGDGPETSLEAVQARGEQGSGAHDGDERDSGVAALVNTLRKRLAFWLMSPRPRTWMTTVSTIKGRPQAQSADQAMSLGATKVQAAMAIVIESSRCFHPAAEPNYPRISAGLYAPTTWYGKRPHPGLNQRFG